MTNHKKIPIQKDRTQFTIHKKWICLNCLKHTDGTIDFPINLAPLDHKCLNNFNYCYHINASNSSHSTNPRETKGKKKLLAIWKWFSHFAVATDTEWKVYLNWMRKKTSKRFFSLISLFFGLRHRILNDFLKFARLLHRNEILDFPLNFA